jgi:histidine triad (HIT) family protein
MSDCLFCKIIAGDIPSVSVYEDEQIFVFKDINPVAEVHILAVPKKHIKSLDEQTKEDADLLGYMMGKLPELAQSQGLADGFRTIINTGPGGGQEVDHLHIHIMGGSKLPGFT